MYVASIIQLFFQFSVAANMQAIGVVDLRDCGQATALQQSDQERHLVDVDVLMFDAMFVEEIDGFGAETAVRPA